MCKIKSNIICCKEKTINNYEIAVDIIVKELLFSIHEELNKNIKISNKSGIHNINNEDDENNNDENKNSDFANEKTVISASIKKFSEK